MHDVLASLASAVERPAGFLELWAGVEPPLRRAAGFDGLCVVAMDPETLLPSAHLDHHGIPPDRGARLMELEYGTNDLLGFGDMAAAGRVAADLHDETSGAPWSARRWEEVLEPSDRPYEARVVLSDGDEVWGGMCLFRDRGGRPFTAEELARLAVAAPLLARGVRRAVLAAAVGAGGDAAPGVLVFGPDAELRAMSGQAEPWLEQIVDTMAPGPLPIQLRALVHRALAAEPGAPPVRATVPARDGGWATLHADRLSAPDGEPQVSVVVEAARRDRLADVLARLHGLSVREREVAALVLRGASTKAIGARLHLSAWTVQDHLKAIFAKTGVRTRGELSALMLGTEPA